MYDLGSLSNFVDSFGVTLEGILIDLANAKIRTSENLAALLNTNIRLEEQIFLGDESINKITYYELLKALRIVVNGEDDLFEGYLPEAEVCRYFQVNHKKIYKSHPKLPSLLLSFGFDPYQLKKQIGQSLTPQLVFVEVEELQKDFKKDLVSARVIGKPFPSEILIGQAFPASTNIPDGRYIVHGITIPGNDAESKDQNLSGKLMLWLTNNAYKFYTVVLDVEKNNFIASSPFQPDEALQYSLRTWWNNLTYNAAELKVDSDACYMEFQTFRPFKRMMEPKYWFTLMYYSPLLFFTKPIQEAIINRQISPELVAQTNMTLNRGMARLIIGTEADVSDGIISLDYSRPKDLIELYHLFRRQPFLVWDTENDVTLKKKDIRIQVISVAENMCHEYKDQDKDASFKIYINIPEEKFYEVAQVLEKEISYRFPYLQDILEIVNNPNLGNIVSNRIFENGIGCIVGYNISADLNSQENSNTGGSRVGLTDRRAQGLNMGFNGTVTADGIHVVDVWRYLQTYLPPIVGTSLGGFRLYNMANLHMLNVFMPENRGIDYFLDVAEGMYQIMNGNSISYYNLEAMCDITTKVVSDTLMTAELFYRIRDELSFLAALSSRTLSEVSQLPKNLIAMSIWGGKNSIDVFADYDREVKVDNQLASLGLVFFDDILLKEDAGRFIQYFEDIKQLLDAEQVRLVDYYFSFVSSVPLEYARLIEIKKTILRPVEVLIKTLENTIRLSQVAGGINLKKYVFDSKDFEIEGNDIYFTHGIRHKITSYLVNLKSPTNEPHIYSLDRDDFSQRFQGRYRHKPIEFLKAILNSNGQKDRTPALYRDGSIKFVKRENYDNDDFKQSAIDYGKLLVINSGKSSIKIFQNNGSDKYWIGFSHKYSGLSNWGKSCISDMVDSIFYHHEGGNIDNVQIGNLLLFQMLKYINYAYSANLADDAQLMDFRKKPGSKSRLPSGYEDEEVIYVIEHLSVAATEILALGLNLPTGKSRKTLEKDLESVDPDRTSRYEFMSDDGFRYDFKVHKVIRYKQFRMDAQMRERYGIDTEVYIDELKNRYNNLIGPLMENLSYGPYDSPLKTEGKALFTDVLNYVRSRYATDGKLASPRTGFEKIIENMFNQIIQS